MNAMTRGSRFTPAARIVPALLLALLMAPAWCQEAPSAAHALEGDWLGALDLGAMKLRLALHVTRGDGGAYEATLDSIDQGAMGLGIDEIRFEGGKVELAMHALSASFSGVMSEDGESIAGDWKQVGELPLVFERSQEPFVLRRPQEPKPPFPYTVLEVAYRSGPADQPFELSATLTLPEGEGPFPAVLMVTGSGPQDRDESLLGHRPFLVLADALARRGIASLRADDRGVGKSRGDFATADTRDFVQDALAGVEFLTAREDVDQSRIGVLGHSEGALVAPMASMQSRDVDFIVLLAAPGVPGMDIIVHQVGLIGRASGIEEERVAAQADGMRRLFETLVGLEEGDDDAPLRAILAELYETASELERKMMPSVETYTRNQLASLRNRWFEFFMGHDPAAILEQVRAPVLALWGERDLQVDPAQNLPPVVAALERGACSDYTVAKLPGLNHLFQPCETGSPGEYGEIEITMSPRVLQMIADWIAVVPPGE